ncbi:ABC transporter G family member 30 [Phytophthora citrophthora]|uniref:ABC transporter G family member 30 n=1 Tax=Phytophthora citrophthora TaxID=4793 RepID=A0AAD9LS68_9STRA|nr:ABC transporter G family member 30 [Phytophthora citrophthora]
MGKAESLLPRLEVRCKELSVVIETDALSGESSGLPSIFNTLKHAVGRFIGSRRQTERHIFNQVNAVFKPGTLTLFLGQPGSGKSTLMKVLAGQFSMDMNVTVKGEISYNGLEWKEVLPKLPQFASYVPQNDHHFPSLTVQETLDFAHLCCAGHLDQLQHCPEAIIDQFGLNSCRDTQIDNTLNRGVSGGECRRVKSDEMQFGTKSIAFLDEISTGLDSATTFDIIWRQREIARNEQKTIVMSLLQPTPEVFELFDSILLLNDGDVLYHVPRDQVLPYFQNLGLICPLKVDIADFLLDIATKQQQQYEMIRTGNLLSRIPRRGREFADRFRQSSLFKDTMRMLKIPPSMEMQCNICWKHHNTDNHSGPGLQRWQSAS